MSKDTHATELEVLVGKAATDYTKHQTIKGVERLHVKALDAILEKSSLPKNTA